MAQGIARDKDEVLKALEHYFKLGCNVTKACAYAGIPRTTVQTWLEEDEDLRLKVTSWQNQISTKARENIKNRIDKGDSITSMAWLSKKEKDEFSDRIENTGKDGEALSTLLVKFIDGKPKDNRDSS